MKILNIFKKKKDNAIAHSCSVTTNWKRNITFEPTFEDFNSAWHIVFGYNFNECTVFGVETGINTGFSVKTPKGAHTHGGFGYHIENPRLEKPDDIYYEGCGCTWNTDLDGVRYHKLNRATGLPVYYKKVCAIEIIRRFIANNQNRFTRAIEQNDKK